MIDALGDRMKTYEAVPKNFLTRRTPVIIRLDGKAFHTFTKAFQKPFDKILIKTMQQTMKYLCENIQGCVFGYTQSDEITLVLIDYQNLDTSAWYDYNVQKIVSVSSSLATMSFNKFLRYNIEDYALAWKTSLTPQSVEVQEEHSKYLNSMRAAAEKGALFDARCFNLPKEEVANCLIWRQKDAIRNSVNAWGQSLFNHKTLEGLNNEQVKLLCTNASYPWENLPIHWQRGSSCFYMQVGAERTGWVIDEHTPLFTEKRSYINKRILYNEELGNLLI